MQSSFLLLCTLCKQGYYHSLKRRHHESLHNSRELAMRLLAFEGLIDLCGSAGDHFSSSKIVGYLVRRLVVSCILANASESMKIHRLFCKILRLINVLWKIWRTHVRMEFALLSEFFVVRVLLAEKGQIRPEFQMTVIGT